MESKNNSLLGDHPQGRGQLPYPVAGGGYYNVPVVWVGVSVAVAYPASAGLLPLTGVPALAIPPGGAYPVSLSAQLPQGAVHNSASVKTDPRPLVAREVSRAPAKASKKPKAHKQPQGVCLGAKRIKKWQDVALLRRIEQLRGLVPHAHGRAGGYVEEGELPSLSRVPVKGSGDQEPLLPDDSGSEALLKLEAAYAESAQRAASLLPTSPAGLSPAVQKAILPDFVWSALQEEREKPLCELLHKRGKWFYGKMVNRLPGSSKS